MEPVGLAVGIVGLVGLFSTCLEVIDKVQSYKTFANDSHVLDSQFNAGKLRFEQWGRAVGLAPGTPSANHHDALDEPDVRAVVGDILSIVRSICTTDGSSGGAIAHSNIRAGRYDMPSAGQGPLDGEHIRNMVTWRADIRQSLSQFEAQMNAETIRELSN
ncbi:hypothetical protein NKR23_g11419 [Pleurostoma richardsiae]|uniref:Prion-inhibition and propagation HeLo domain-containing protein n=1 Tax=Pleurostoma richardsiae TaxID=41990 RepID=A0AA38R7S6_9PEZI|nr:hypothetical protein NKR23_g11419 [Pleurostoma richardsiae]